MDNVLTTVETRVQDVRLTAIDNLLIPRLEVAMKSVNASSRQDIHSVAPDQDQKDFSGDVEDRQLTALTRMNSSTDLYKIDETPGSVNVEGGSLSVHERNFDQQTNINHSNVLINYAFYHKP